jgi:F-type H+-transporting ATPase subunit epsilon
MANKTIKFKIVTPERIAYDEEVEQVSLPTLEGQITVLPDHESLIGVIEPGEVCIKKKGAGSCFLAISDGFLEIDNNLVRVFADTADRAEELDEEAILKAKEAAENALKNKRDASEVAFADAAAHLRRELAKLKVLKRRKR